ncbi:MAG: hypothetical protein QOG72_230 [Sphingomonadales bacterium]|jgi:hypothetical protein|nr:hypothetical protein [Sphingomonadales bacterium]
MQPIIAMLIQTAAALGPAPDRRPPALDEGWVFPTSVTKAATADCPVIGPISAEFRFGPGGRTKVVGVRGLGRVASAADRRKIDDMIGPMQGLSDVSVSCWGHIAAVVLVRGIYDIEGSPRQRLSASSGAATGRAGFRTTRSILRWSADAALSGRLPH